MVNKTQEKSFTQEAFETFVKIKLEMIDAFKDIPALKTDTMLAKTFIGKTAPGVGVVMEYIEGHSWDQIAGRAFGTVVDIALLKGITKSFGLNPTDVKCQYANNVAQGGAILALEGATDFSAADYFEKAFPAALEFAKTLKDDLVNGDGAYAKQVWEGLKATADIDLIKNYYANVTPKQFFNDFKELFDPSYTPPQISQSNVTVSVPNAEPNHIIANFQNSTDIEKAIIQEAVKRDEITKLTLNDKTYNIAKDNNISIRNSIDNIPEASFLLSHILIKKGETLDVGEQGFYKVSAGNTASVIAERFDLTTKELVKLNSWLIDEGRVTFNQGKVLVEEQNISLNGRDSAPKETSGKPTLAQMVKEFKEYQLQKAADGDRYKERGFER
ncbi:MAG: hypothetical protein LBQ18_08715 [Campylobacteraceae bacterium]|jgi:hypothetical protein|nr:hypothetical protein [Campylobacteraceae bacterium]